MSTSPNPPARSRLSLGEFGSSLFPSLLIYLLEITFVVSFAALIFSGELSNQLPQAVGFIILGDAIMMGAISLLSSYPGSIAIEQDTPGAIMSVVAVAIIAALPDAPARQFATVVMMIVVTTTLTGVIFLALGFFKMGRLIRFLPYPVMGGFLAGTGWLLAAGGIGVMTDLSMGIQWFQRGAFTLWLPGVLLGFLIHFATLKIKKPFTIPALLILAALAFYGIVAITHTSLEQLHTHGWLLNLAATGTLWQFPLRPTLLAQVDWHILLQQIPAMAPAAVISVIALLLNTSGLELIVKKDIDLNRELIGAGLSNLISGPMGGLIGYHAISLSNLNFNLSGGKRLVGIMTAILIGLTIFVGTSVIALIPKFIFGSVLFYLGLGLLVEWVYEAWFKFPRIDFLVIISILIVIIVSGFLQGILVGLVLAVIMFVVSYSQVSVIQFALTGQEYRSRITRTPAEQQILNVQGDRIYMLKLQGFIFFGTANTIFTQTRDYIRTNPTMPVTYILLDFAKVSGMDSTGMLSYSRMLQWCQERGITLILTGLAGRTKAQVDMEPAFHNNELVKFFPDLDHGLGWCENQVIAQHVPTQGKASELAFHLQALLQDENSHKLIPFLQRREYQPGEYLMKEGDAPDYIYFIESGLVTAQLESPNKAPVRLETMGGGRTVGELGFYLGTRRTAHVICEQEAVVYTLSMEDLKRMETEDPEAASLFHRITVRLLSERVTHLTRTVSALERL